MSPASSAGQVARLPAGGSVAEDRGQERLPAEPVDGGRPARRDGGRARDGPQQRDLTDPTAPPALALACYSKSM
jgi:hypothetical protein